MSTLQDRIAEIMSATGLTVGQIAEITGVSSSAVTQWKDGPTKSLKAVPAARLASKTGYSAVWISSGEGPKRLSSASSFDANAVITPMGIRRVPLISSIQAGLWSEIVDNFALGDAEEWLQTDVKCSQSSFALTIKGNSMEPAFSDGDRVIIDPEVAPRPGSFVAAKNGSEEATFKKYRPRSISASGEDVFELVPLNDDYPSLHSDREPIRIIGTAVEHRRRLG